MKIATIMRGERESGDHLLEMSQDELQTLVEVFHHFCEANKRKKKAARMLKQFESELCIYG